MDTDFLRRQAFIGAVISTRAPTPSLIIPQLPEHLEWGDDGEITFLIPEHVAWQINELAEEEGYSWACFAPALAAKLNNFCWSIV